MRRSELYLADIIEAADDIAEFVLGLDRDSFASNKIVRSAVLQKLIVIGEAASRLSSEFRERHGDIEWADIAAFRNRVVHAYFSVEWEIVWVAVTEEVARLRQQIAQIASDEDRD